MWRGTPQFQSLHAPLELLFTIAVPMPLSSMAGPQSFRPLSLSLSHFTFTFFLIPLFNILLVPQWTFHAPLPCTAWPQTSCLISLSFLFYFSLKPSLTLIVLSFTLILLLLSSWSHLLFPVNLPLASSLYGSTSNFLSPYTFTFSIYFLNSLLLSSWSQSYPT